MYERSSSDNWLYYLLTHTHTHTYTLIYIYVYIYIYIYIYIYKICNLCPGEKIQIMFYFDPVNLLNQRCNFIARQRNRNKFRLFSKIS